MTFDLPAFNGSVRSPRSRGRSDKVGSAQADVTVRDAVVVAATLPRFLDVGDRSQMTSTSTTSRATLATTRSTSTSTGR